MRLRDLPIRRKVTALIMVASAIALVLAGVGVIVYDLTTVRPRVERDLMSQADLLRANTTAALVFGDAQAASENLATLSARPTIPAAGIYLPDGTLFASYTSREHEPPALGPSPSPGVQERSGHLVMLTRIASDGRQIGWLVLRYDLPSFWARLPQYGLLVTVLVAALFIVSVLLSRFLRFSIITPIRDLSEVSRAVSLTRDYNLRASRASHDEIGQLTDSFNEMLATLQQRDRALHESAQRLRETMLAARMLSWDWNRDDDSLVLGEGAPLLDDLGEIPRTLEAFLSWVHPDDRVHLREGLGQALAQSHALDLDLRLVLPDGRIRWLSLRGQIEPGNDPRRVFGLMVDVTDRRQLEEQLTQAQKMEAIGRLAGGIAHDFNNLLTAILGYARFALKSLPPDLPAREDVQEIERAGERAASLTGQLLAYARRQMIAPRPTNLNQLVGGLEVMLQRLIGEHIQLQTRTDPALWPVRVDAGQFEQVLLNLSVNARDAMPQGGRLVISTRNCPGNPGAPPPHPDVPPGDYVLLQVSDTGSGMDAEIQGRIFEPFFTTKEPGKGTGLGLAVCYGIVAETGGLIWVDSQPGSGSTFSILLPAAPGAELEGEASRPVSQVTGGRGETVLVAEDEPLVRALAVRSLGAGGFRVLQAHDGESALALAEAYPGQIDLLLTDVVMPGMNGVDLAQQLATLRPEVRVVFMSGYADQALVPRHLLDHGVPLLSKPFDPALLVGIARRVLDQDDFPSPSTDRGAMA